MCSPSPAHLRIWQVQSLTACCAVYVDYISFRLWIIVPDYCQQCEVSYCVNFQPFFSNMICAADN